MNIPRIIGISGKMHAGKTTVAKYLVEHYGYNRIRFAGPLKNMLYALGLNEREVDGDLKEVPCDKLCGKTPRWAMQSLGTEWGRKLIGDSIWTDAWKRFASDLGGEAHIVVEDYRFPNECELIHERGGKLLRIEGRGGAAGKHESEAHELPADIVIQNDETFDVLYDRLEHALRLFAA